MKFIVIGLIASQVSAQLPKLTTPKDCLSTTANACTDPAAATAVKKFVADSGT